MSNYYEACPRCGHNLVPAHGTYQMPCPPETRTQPAEDERVNGVYVASRASVPERGAMWRRFRAQGIPITSSWIDEDGQGETQSLSELWQRIASEIAISVGVVLYVEPNDFPLKGALIEVGIALGMNKPIIVCLPGVTLEERSYRPIGSWVRHPLVTRCDDVERALNLLPVQPAASTPTEPLVSFGPEPTTAGQKQVVIHDYGDKKVYTSQPPKPFESDDPPTSEAARAHGLRRIKRKHYDPDAQSLPAAATTEAQNDQ